MFRQEEILKNAEKSKGSLKEKEKMLAEDEAENEKEMRIAESLIKEGSERLQKAIQNKNFAEAVSQVPLLMEVIRKLKYLKSTRKK